MKVNMSKKQLIEKLHGETALLSWSEIMPHYARNVVFRVASHVDLIELAAIMIEDDAGAIQSAMQSNQLAKLDVATAKKWANNESSKLTLWAVVVAPWVLVQESKG